MKASLSQPVLEAKASTRKPRRMAAPPKTYIRVQVDEALKHEADDVFTNLGFDTPTAIRIFLNKAVMARGIPFEVNQFNAETLEALEESERISRDPNVKGYTDVDEMIREILADV